MFPMTITISNIADLQKVQSVLYPTTGVIEGTDKSRDVLTTKTNDANLQTLVNKTEAAHSPQPTEAAKDEPAAQTAHIQRTATEGQEGAAQGTSGTSASPTTEHVGATSAKPLDYKVDVKPRILGLIKAGKRDDVAKVLSGFKVENAQDLAPEKWPGLLAELAKLEG